MLGNRLCAWTFPDRLHLWKNAQYSLECGDYDAYLQNCIEYLNAIDIVNDKLIAYKNGEGSEVSNLSNVTERLDELKEYLDEQFLTYKPVAVFG